MHHRWTSHSIPLTALKPGTSKSTAICWAQAGYFRVLFPSSGRQTVHLEQHWPRALSLICRLVLVRPVLADRPSLDESVLIAESSR